MECKYNTKIQERLHIMSSTIIYFLFCQIKIHLTGKGHVPFNSALSVPVRRDSSQTINEDRQLNEDS